MSAAGVRAGSSERLAGVLAATVRRDALAGTVLWTFLALSLALSLADGLTGGATAAWFRSGPAHGLELALLALVLASLGWRLERVELPWERVFWERLVSAYGCWFLGSAFALLPERIGGLPRRPFQVVFYAFFYILMIRAVEGRPHRRPPPLRSGLERLLAWPTVTFFVLGLVIYFVFIPLVTQWETAAGRPPGAPANRLDEFYVYTLLDLYLSVRLLLLARQAGSRRWRALYAALALPWIGFFLTADLGVIAAETALKWPAPGEWWAYSPFVLQVLAARIRHRPFAGEREPAGGELAAPPAAAPGATGPPLAASLPQTGGEEMSFNVSAQTLFLGVLFPVLHILTTRFELVVAPGQAVRQALVLVWLVFFGVIALVQHRQLERHAQNLWLDRVSFEEEMRASEKDLRLIIERSRAVEMLRDSEEKFDLAFRACPYTLMITRLEDGCFLEVNPGFEETFGYTREEVVDRSAEQLGLWLDPEAMRALDRRLARKRRIREAAVTFRKKSGEERTGLLSAVKIELGGERCLLSIVHDVTEARRRQERLETAVELLDAAAAAIFEIGDDGRIRSWSRGAARLTGWTVKEAVGRPAADLVGDAGATWHGGGEHGEWVGEIELARRRGEPLRLLGWRTRIAGSDSSQLVVGTAPA